jgi:hypothetical protein
MILYQTRMIHKLIIQLLQIIQVQVLIKLHRINRQIKINQTIKDQIFNRQKKTSNFRKLALKKTNQMTLN